MTTLKLIGGATIRVALLAGVWAAQDGAPNVPRQPDKTTQLIQRQAVPDMSPISATARLISMAQR